jgi:hypothetical protein
MGPFVARSKENIPGYHLGPPLHANGVSCGVVTEMTGYDTTAVGTIHQSDQGVDQGKAFLIRGESGGYHKALGVLELDTDGVVDGPVGVVGENARVVVTEGVQGAANLQIKLGGALAAAAACRSSG